MTRLYYFGLCVLGVLAHSQAGYSQIFDRAIVLENVQILGGDGQILERGSLVIKGSRVVGMGQDVKVPIWSSRHDLSGRTVTPGLIDAWSTLGLTTSAASDELGRAWDAFDPYAQEVLRAAIRNGVTTIYITPGRSPGINGVGAVVRLTKNEDGSIGSLVHKDAALAISFGPANSPIARLKTFEEVRKKFRTALDYRESLEDYQEELKEYLEKLEARRKEKEGADDAEADEKVKEDDKDSPAVSDETKTPPKPAPKPDEGGKRGSFSYAGGLSSSHSAFAGDDDTNGNDKGDKSDKESKDEKDKEEELTKPTKPTIDRVSELLLEAIDHELGVRILAQRSDGILNALALAAEFNLDVTIEGATEAYLVASELAKADVGLIVGQVSRSGLFRSNQFRRYREGQVDVLERAHIAWTISSGGRSELVSRFVSFNAQLAASQTEQVNWLSLVTTRAAKMLGVSSRVGALGVGRIADLVVWSSDPSDPGAFVERVYVGGKLVYDYGNIDDGEGR